VGGVISSIFLLKHETNPPQKGHFF